MGVVSSSIIMHLSIGPSCYNEWMNLTSLSQSEILSTTEDLREIYSKDTCLSLVTIVLLSTRDLKKLLMVHHNTCSSCWQIYILTSVKSTGSRPCLPRCPQTTERKTKLCKITNRQQGSEKREGKSMWWQNIKKIWNERRDTGHIPTHSLTKALNNNIWSLHWSWSHLAFSWEARVHSHTSLQAITSDLWPFFW